MKKTSIPIFCILLFCISCKQQSWQTEDTPLVSDTTKSVKQIDQASLKTRKNVIKHFRNDLETITATYSLNNHKSWVKLESNAENHHPIVLNQLNDYINTTEYGNDTILWQDKDDRSLLIINGVENEYSRTN